jgi:hypothetical protein
MLFFIDESVQQDTEGKDVAVLTGIGIKEQHLREIGRELFNTNKTFWHISEPFDFEIKGRKLLNKRQARLPKNIAYVENIVHLCKKYDVYWAATFTKDIGPQMDALWRGEDLRESRHLSLLFQRLLERIAGITADYDPNGFALMLYDAPDKSRCERIATLIMSYFYRTQTGQAWKNVVPTPYFVDSKITAGIQIADLFCYIIAGALADRQELRGLFDLIKRELMYVSPDGNLRGLRGCQERALEDADEDEEGK